MVSPLEQTYSGHELVALEHLNPRIDNLLRVEWNLGKLCNYDCSYCPSDLHDNSSKYLSLDQMKSVVDQVFSAYPERRIRFGLTGGEPFLNPHLPQLLEYLTEKGVDGISVTSNGSRPKDVYLNSIKSMRHLIISYHFERASKNHVLDLVQNVARKIAELREVDHIDRLLVVHVMMLPGRFEEAKEIIAFLKANDIRYVLRRIRPLYRPDGTLNSPGSSGLQGVHKPAPDPELQGAGPDDAAADNYYSKDELDFLGANNPSQDSASFFNAIAHRVNENGEISSAPLNVNKLTTDRENRFFGWSCSAGIQTLAISSDGRYFRTVCKVGGRIGTIATGFEQPIGPVICTKKWCNCAADLNVTKFKTEYGHVVRQPNRSL